MISWSRIPVIHHNLNKKYWHCLHYLCNHTSPIMIHHDKTNYNVSCVMRTYFCICKNKGTDQFCVITQPISTWAASWENQQFAYAKTKTQISFAVTAKLISAFVFATWIVQYLYFLNTKFQTSSHLQWLHSLVCARPGQNPHCWFSRVAAHIVFLLLRLYNPYSS